MTDSYEDIGSLLQAARKETRMSIQQASTLLHIRARYLEALEEGKFGELPGDAYIKGYLLAYAGFLDLDKDEILRRLEAIADLPKRGLYLPESFSQEKKPTQQAIWGGLGLALAAYLLWAVAFKQSAAPVTIELPPKPVAVVYGGLPLDGPCFRRLDGVYPPCYNDARAEAFVWLPLPHKVVSLDLY